MDYSDEQATEVTCNHCKNTYTELIWIIVDPRQNPRLARIIADGDLNKLRCPKCRSVAIFPNPVLLYQKDEIVSVVVGAPPSQSRHEIQEQTHYLLAMLYSKLTPAEQRALLSNPDVIFPSPVVVPHSALKDFTDVEGRRPDSTSLKAIVHCLEQIPEGAPKEAIYKLAKRALELLDSGHNPQYWAWLKGLLSSASADIEEGILHMQEALTIFTEIDSPLNWGRGQNDLAHLYLDRTVGDKSANIEAAIRHFRSALRTLTPGTSPIEWAMCNNDLSVAYSERIESDRTENQELALFHAEATLNVFSRETNPEYWARSQTRIGAILRDRLVGDKADNLSKAIHHYNLALRYHTEKQNPIESAGIHSLLGQAYLVLIGIREDPQDLPDRAIHHLEMALGTLSKNEDPDRWARILGNLALAYEFRKTGDGDANLRRAIEYFQMTEEVFSCDTYPALWADTQANIAGLYMKFKTLEPKEIDAKRIGLLSSAAAVYKDTFQPVKFIDVIQRLAAIYLVNHQWLEAHQAYESAFQAANELYGSAYTAAGRQSELASVSGLCANDAYALVQLGRHNVALERLEQGRAKLLKEALASEGFSSGTFDEAHRSQLKTQQQRIDQLEAAMRVSSDGLTGRPIREVAGDLQAARSALGSLRVASGAKQQAHLADFTFTKILAMVPVNGALIAPFSGLGGSAFVIPYGCGSLSEINVIELSKPSKPTSQPGSLLEFVDHMCAGVSKMVEPIVERLSTFHLAEGSPVVVMGGVLDLFALHATSRQTTEGTRLFLDDYTVSYVPSCELLKICQDRLKSRGKDKSSVLTVTDPTDDLRFAQVESDRLSDVFAQNFNLPGKKATTAAVVEGTKGMPYVHFACHGYYLPEDPLRSGLRLANGAEFTAEDVIVRLDLSASRLVVLSACQTGLTDFGSLRDEYVGLPAAFLQAGAPAVVSTLWEVDDMSTMLLMDRFYKGHCLENVSAPNALRAAQRWLRDVTNAELLLLFDCFRQMATDAKKPMYARLQEKVVKDTLSDPNDKPFEHPFFWAGFTYTGAEV